MSKVYDSNHASVILSKLNRERKSSSDYCDVTITAGKSEFPAHKCILQAISTFYNKMFTIEMKEKYENKAVMHGISENTMEIIMDFIYTCNIQINNKNVFEVLEAADYLDIPYLKVFCMDFLISNLTYINCLSIRSYAKTHGHTKVVHACNKMLNDEIESIVQTEEFRQLALTDVMTLLQHNNKISCEELMYYAIFGWLKYDLGKRKKHLIKLFNLIKLERLSEEFVRGVAAGEELVMNSPECTKMILKRLLSEDNGESANFSPNDSTGEIVVVKGKQVYKCDIVNMKLQQIQDSKVDHSDGSAVCYNKEIYLIGSHKSQSVERSVNLTKKNLAFEWMEVKATNYKRIFAASVVCGNQIYTVGGAISGWISSSSLGSGERYNHQKNEWTLIKRMKRGRSGHALVAMNDKLFAIGGYDRGCLNTVECYDTLTEKWSDVTPMKTKRYGLAAVVLNNKIYAIGGQWYNVLLRCVERYDPDTRTWNNVASLNVPRSGHSACVIDGKIYVVAGGWRNDTIEVYDETRNKWTIHAKFEVLKGSRCIAAM